MANLPQKSPSHQTQRGIAMVEVALTLPVFLIVLFLGVETLRMSFTAVTLQHAATRGVRYASLLRPPCCGHSRAEDIKQQVVGFAAGVTLSPRNIQICPVANLRCNGAEAGVPGETVALTITQPFQLLGSSLTMPVSVSAVARNEPF